MYTDRQIHPRFRFEVTRVKMQKFWVVTAVYLRLVIMHARVTDKLIPHQVLKICALSLSKLLTYGHQMCVADASDGFIN